MFFREYMNKMEYILKVYEQNVARNILSTTGTTFVKSKDDNCALGPTARHGLNITNKLQTKGKNSKYTST